MKTHTLKLPAEPAPRHTQRRIVWGEDGIGQAVILVGYCPQDLPHYLGLVLDLQKHIPDVDLKTVQFGRVTQSPTIKGFTLLMADVRGPKREIPGFEEWGSIDFNW